MRDEPIDSTIDDVARALTNEPGPHDLAARVVARLETPVTRSTRGRWIAVTASAAALGAIAVLLSRGGSPRQEGAESDPTAAQRRQLDASQRPTVVPPSSVMRTLVWVDREGREEPIPLPPLAYGSVRLSPDGTRVAFHTRDQAHDVWIADLHRLVVTRLTFDPGEDVAPVWTPDARRIVFSSSRAGVANLYWQAGDGSGAVERLTVSPNSQVPSAFLRDGTGVVLEEQTSGSGRDLHLLRLADQKSVAVPLIQTPFDETAADISPDGRWLAYASNESGRMEIYVHPFPGVGSGRLQVSTGGGSQPRWRPDARELFYSDQGSVIAVAVSPIPGFVVSSRTELFEGPYADGFDVSPDGQRFLMIKDMAAPNR